MIFIILIIAILFYELLKRIQEYLQGSRCISMSSFKVKEYLPRFNEIYDDIIKETDEVLEPMREKTRAIMLLRYISYISSFWIMFSGIYNIFLGEIIFSLLIITFSIMVLAFAVYTEKYVNLFYAEYLEKYKELVINKFVRDINKGFGYSLRGAIEKNIFEESYSNPIAINHYYGCDYITGVVEGKRTLYMSELYAKLLNENKKEIFCGLFCYFKTNYEDEMKVECKDRKLTYKNIPLNMQVGIERFIKEFEQDNRIDFKLLMRNGKIFIKLYCGDLLKPAVFIRDITKKRLWVYYTLIKFSVDLSDMINNVKIKK
ncbi:MAG: hypothetical protein MJ245_04360 [Clostridia bacterium]|nr:hypothetical protein [Clostridia bacterium]